MSEISNSLLLMFTVNREINSKHEGYRASVTQTLGENMAVKTQGNFKKTILSGITDSPSLMFTVNTAIYSEHEGYRASETQTLRENMAVKTQDNFEWDY